MKIAANKRSFEQNGEQVFYLADTCWSAFTNIREEDWDYYLDYRKAQGFNVIQVNMLWQWDASETDLDYLPFEKLENGYFDFSKLNEAYFERAERMVAKAYEKNLTVALVLLWSNYLPNTWASDLKIRQVGLFPKDLLEDYVQKVVKTFDQYQPIYIISGDTDFQTDEIIYDYYEKALNTVKELSPEALTTLHIRGREKDIPQALQENCNLDIYFFQSGHNNSFRQMPYELAEEFYRKEPIRPIVNSEPCYEMISYSRGEYGRFSREDVRRAAWQSILSGAAAGITYGAHGIWSWHSDNVSFDSEVGEAFATPFDWHDALKFEGAWDYAFIKKFMEEHHLHNINPETNLILNNTSEIRASSNEDYTIIYLPSTIDLRLKGNFANKKMTYLHLEDKRQTPAKAMYHKNKDETVIKMHHFVRDALLIIEK